MTDFHPNLRRWLGEWLEQMPNDGEYRVLQYELTHAHDLAQYQADLARLDSHLELAAGLCRDFHKLIAEKQKLPGDRLSANQTVLDKLAEVRAIIGLSRLGFTDITFTESPDLAARCEDTTYAIEVTRLAASDTTADSWWDSRQTSEGGFELTVASSEGRLPDDMSKQIYSKVWSKGAQLNNVRDAIAPLVWISLGRDYFTVGESERKGTGLKVRMRRGLAKALVVATNEAVKASLIPRLSGVVLSLGRDENDLWRKIA